MSAHPFRLGRALSIGITGTALAMSISAVAVPAEPPVREEAPVDYHQWRTPKDFKAGTLDGLVVGKDGLTVGTPAGTIEHTEPDLGTTRTYEYGQWTSPTYEHGFGATQLVASWNAITPKNTWLAVEMRGSTDGGAETAWYTMGRWASGDTDILRTSVPDQSDASGSVDVDTFVAKSGVTLTGYQLRVTLYREAGSTATPKLAMTGAMTSAIPDRFEVPTSGENGAWGIELPVPRYAQNLHEGHYPEYGGGGEAWCSPTSTEMVVEYWGKGPSEEDLSWVDPSYSDKSVDHAARFTYDKDYDGTGNWPFNTAYAATFGLSGHITRLGSLADAERYIKAGIPVITSQSFLASELDGAGYGTAGHIMVIVGFTKTGDVIVNDPASSTNDGVRNVYKRAQFENIWQRTKRHTENGSVASGPGGVAYIIAPPGKKLPRP
jgi:peptidase C39-like protein